MSIVLRKASLKVTLGPLAALALGLGCNAPGTDSPPGDGSGENVGKLGSAIYDGEAWDGGAPAAPFQVVRIDTDHFERPDPACSGTFIARDWILTAAHCVSKPNEQQHPPRPDEPPSRIPSNFIDHYPITLRYQDASGTVRVLGGAKIWVHSYPFANYSGDPGSATRPATADEDRDIALIKVDWEEKAALSLDPDVYALPLAVGRASGNMAIAGWGTTSDASQGASDTLRRPRGLAPVNVANGGAHKARIVAPATDAARICRGDSGGPLLHEVDGVRIIQGVASSAAIASKTFNCPPVGGNMNWSSVDDKLKWIESIIRAVDGDKKFSCQRLRTPSGVKYAQCWTSRCTAEVPCTLPHQRCIGAKPTRSGKCGQ